IRVRPLVVRPDMLLRKAHAIEDLLGFTATAVGELFGVAELATDALDNARLAADVVGRADVARRIAPSDRDLAAAGKARRHGLPALGPSGRFSMSASLARSSSMLIVPRCTSAEAIELIQRS